jgi:hypothetical protein
MNTYEKAQIKKWKTWKIIAYLIFFLTFLVYAMIYKVPILPLAILILICALAFLVIDLAETKEKTFLQEVVGENLVRSELKKIEGIKYFQNVKINSKTIIDFIILSKSGIFLLEVQNNEGKLSAIKDQWYIVDENFRKNEITSFSGQAKSKSRQLFNFIEYKIPHLKVPFIYPVIVFSKVYDHNDINSNFAEDKYFHCSYNEISEILIKGISNISTKDIEEISKLLS